MKIFCEIFTLYWTWNQKITWNLALTPCFDRNSIQFAVLLWWRFRSNHHHPQWKYSSFNRMEITKYHSIIKIFCKILTQYWTRNQKIAWNLTLDLTEILFDACRSREKQSPALSIHHLMGWKTTNYFLRLRQRKRSPLRIAFVVVVVVVVVCLDFH